MRRCENAKILSIVLCVRDIIAIILSIFLSAVGNKMLR